MDKIIKIFTFVSIILLSSCYYDNPILTNDDPNAPPQFVSFSGDLIPLFNANCNNSGCHDDVPAHAPSLVEGKAYNALIQGGYVNTTIPDESVVYTVVKNGSMPPGGQLSSRDIKLIYDWIRNGAPQN